MPRVTDPNLRQQLGGAPVGVAIGGSKAPASPTGYSLPGAPAISYQRGGPDDPTVIARNESIRAGIAAARAKDVAAYQQSLEIGANAAKNQQNANAPVPANQRFDNVSGLRKEIDGRDAVKTYKNALPSYASALRSPDTPAGDQDMIYAFAKIMDPNSVVREGEAASVANLGTLGQKIAGDLRKQLDGDGKFTPSLRAQLRQTIAGRVGEYNKAYTAERQFFRSIAERNGLNPDDIIGPHLGDAYAKIENKYFRGDENLGAAAAGQRRQELGAGRFDPTGGGGIDPTGGPSGAPSTGATRTEADRSTMTLVDGMIRQGMSADQINAVLIPAGLSQGVQAADVQRAQDLLKKYPDYKGGFAVATKEVPNSLLTRAVGTPVGTAIGSFADGVMGGLTDEIAAAPTALATGQSYGDTLADLNARKQGAFEANPKAAFIGGAGGSTLGLFAGAKLLGGANMAAQLGRAAPYVGAIGEGAISGAGQNNDNRALGALAGGAAGATGYGLGELAAIPVGAALRTKVGRAALGRAQSLPRIGGAFGAPLPKAVERLSPAEIAMDNAFNQVGPDNLRGSLGEAGNLGVPMSLADTAPQLTTLAGSAVRRSPNAAQIAELAFRPRSRAQIDRLGSAVTRDLGPIGNIPQISQDIGESAKGLAAPLYKQAYAAPAIGSPEIDSLLGTPFGQGALARANRIAANERRDPKALGFSLDEGGNVVLNPVDPQLHFDAASARSTYDDAVKVAADNHQAAVNELSRQQRLAQGGAAKGGAVAKAQADVAAAKNVLDSAMANNGAVESTVGALGAQPTPGMAASQRVYSPQTLDYVKRGMDDSLEAYRNPITNKLVLDESGRAENGVLRSFLKEADTLNPAYGQARAAYGGEISSRDALARGQDAFSLSPDELGMQVGGQSPEHLSQMQLGHRSELMNRANNVRDASNPWEATLGTPNARARIDTLYPGNPGNANLFRTRDLEGQLAGSTNAVLGNSMTAQRQIADNAFESAVPALAADVGTMALGGVPLATASRVLLKNRVGDVLKIGMGKRAAKKADDLAPLLFDTDPVRSLASAEDIMQRAGDYRFYVKNSRPSRRIGMFGAGIGSSEGSRY